MPAASSAFVPAVLAGTGDPTGADGSIKAGTTGIDGALRIVDGLGARFAAR